MNQVLLGVIAVALGFALGFLAFVPYVMITIRRHGSFGVRRALTSLAALVYGVAIWTYTLLPMPLPSEVRCAGSNLDLFAFVDDIAGAISRGHPLTDFAVLQLVLNVALFVPLGVLVRVLWHRGILVSLALGFGISLLIETTQLTGVWGFYPCAYRVFDVDDLLTNTLGAVVGSLISLALPRSWRLSAADAAIAGRPRPVTRGRRLLAMLVDLIGTSLFSWVVVTAVSLVVLLIGGLEALQRHTDTIVAIVTWAVLLFTGAITLVTGYTLGDASVRLRYTGSRMPVTFARLLRFLGGIGGYQLLSTVWPQGGPVAIFVLLCGILLFTTRQGHGLPGVLSGQRLEDSRVSPALPPAPTAAGQRPRSAR